MKRNYKPKSFVKPKGVVSIANGGTSGNTPALARSKLKLTAATKIGIPRGLILIDAETGVIDESYLAGLSILPIEVDGPKTIAVSTTGTYKITNFDSRIPFSVSADIGTVSIAGDTISYRAPALILSDAGFTVNTSFFPVVITAAV